MTRPSHLTVTWAATEQSAVDRSAEGTTLKVDTTGNAIEIANEFLGLRLPPASKNYRTPEREVPHRPLPDVWETCMTMGDRWSFKANDRYKSTHRLVHLLEDIVAKWQA